MATSTYLSARKEPGEIFTMLDINPQEPKATEAEAQAAATVESGPEYNTTSCTRQLASS
jgi:hypothetical protein